MEPEARNRLIVALDGLSTVRDAMGLVEDLDGVVSFFKVGWELFIAGHWLDLLLELEKGEKRIFLDLKLPGDIGATISSTVKRVSEHQRIEFLTVSTGVPRPTIVAARDARGANPHPKMLVVPLLSSLDENDLAEITGPGRAMSLDDYIVEKARQSLDAGCDGLIAAGDSIALLRARFPHVLLVSPGIRPAGSGSDDHKRLATPAEAIRMGADYLVVGRPVRMQPTREGRRAAASGIVEEIASVR
jgi:orotidine-5'-phosphate decarboxylase